jgi:hypothetical protein
MKKYCKICGKEKDKVFTGYYNEQTGEKEYKYKCLVKDCKHGHHIGRWFFGRKKCKKCGFMQYDGGW